MHTCKSRPVLFPVLRRSSSGIVMGLGRTTANSERALNQRFQSHRERRWRGHSKHRPRPSQGTQTRAPVSPYAPTIQHDWCQKLDEMLASPRWSHLATVWDNPARKELVQLWHDLDGKRSRSPSSRSIIAHHDSVRRHRPGARRTRQVRDRGHPIKRQLSAPDRHGEQITPENGFGTEG
jgi:hypothetical protein